MASQPGWAQSAGDGNPGNGGAWQVVTYGGNIMMQSGDKMEGKLNQLYQYLLNNHYTAEAKKLKDILEEEVSDNKIKKVKEMCTPRYLGDLYIKEFDNANKWWNFLGEVSAEVEAYLV